MKATKNHQAMGFFARLLRSRNVIIVSAGEVKHYPLSTRVLIVSSVAFMVAISWVSYTTGSYLAASSIIAEKEHRLAVTSRANRMMEVQYALIKQDLMKLENKSEDMTDMDRFALRQHASTMDAIFSGEATKNVDLDDDKLSGISQSLLQERVDYLEGMVDQLQGDRVGLLADLRDKTQDQISLYQDIIESTGLNMAKLMQRPGSKNKPTVVIELGKADSGSATDALEDAIPEEVPAGKADPAEDFSHQGGPFIPEEIDNFGNEKEALLIDVEHMMKLSGIVGAMPLARPMDTTQITSRFGRRVDPLTKRWATHRGIDFVGKKNRNVLATADGVVVTAGKEGAYGQMIEIEHGYGLATRYAHLGSISVKVGQKVQEGDIIGQQGNSGRSTGSHLHYEVRFMHSALNPTKFIEAGEHVQK